MSLLINVVGPPTCGKTTLIEMFRGRRPGLTSYESIDNIRVRLSNTAMSPGIAVWDKFQKEVWAMLNDQERGNPIVIIESSGLSTKLPSIVWAAILEGHSVQTIHLTGTAEHFKERLRQRLQAPDYKPIPFEYPELTMEDLIDRCTEKLYKLWKDAEQINTSNAVSLMRSYERFEKVILEGLEKENYQNLVKGLVGSASR